MHSSEAAWGKVWKSLQENLSEGPDQGWTTAAKTLSRYIIITIYLSILLGFMSNELLNPDRSEEF